MTDKKISELTSLSSGSLDSANDEIPIVDSSSGQTKKITPDALFDAVGDSRYIAERGSNANGEYVRFSDGTQICWVTKSFSNISTPNGNVFISSNIPWTFPAAFSSRPNVFADVRSSSATWASAYNQNTTISVLTAINPTSYTGSREIIGTAIGSWS